MTANPSALESFLPQQLRGSVPGLEVHDSPEQRAAYAYDGTATLRAEPAAVVFPVDTAQVSGVLKFAAAGDGLFRPPDPSSMKISTIGGNVAENSGCLRGLKYGVTRDYVMGLEVVLPDGEVMWTGNKCVKDVAGYTLRDLFIGSVATSRGWPPCLRCS